MIADKRIFSKSIRGLNSEPSRMTGRFVMVTVLRPLPNREHLIKQLCPADQVFVVRVGASLDLSCLYESEFSQQAAEDPVVKVPAECLFGDFFRSIALRVTIQKVGEEFQ